MTKKSILKIVLIITLFSFPLSAFADSGDLPTVTTIGSSTSDGVMLQGETTYDGVTNYGFEYGETTDYGKNVTGENQLSQFTFQKSFGSNGTDNGQFSGPTQITKDSSGNLFVLDSYNDRVQKFNSDGEYISQFGSTGTWSGTAVPGTFNAPNGFAIDSKDNIYAVNTYNHRVDEFDSNYNFIKTIGGWGPGSANMRYPQKIAVDKSDNIYVADARYGRAHSFIKKFDSEGNFLQLIGTFGTGDGQLQYPQGVAIADNGNIIVVDSYNNRVETFDPSGQYLSQFGTSGSGDGQFSYPNGISIDATGNIFVADSNNNRIQKFDSEGNYLSQFGSNGNGDSNLSSPNGVFVNSDGNILVADTNNSKIKNFLFSESTSKFNLKVSDLNCETTYHYRAFATNTAGTSNGEDQTFTTGQCAGIVNNISGVATSKSVKLSWDDRSDNGYWQVTYRPTSSNEWHDISVYSDWNGKVSGLDPSTEYVFRVRHSQDGNSGSWGLWSAPFVMSTLAAQTHEISTCRDLQNIGLNTQTGQIGDLEGDYKLIKDIDCSDTTNWNKTPVTIGDMGSSLSGFIPIGIPDFESQNFTQGAFVGNFDGQGHTISNLYEHGTSIVKGLFAMTYRAEIKNLVLDGVNFELTKAEGYVGGLAGATVETTIDNVHVNGQIVSIVGEASKYSPRYNLGETVEAGGKIYVSSYTGNEYEVAVLNSNGSVIRKVSDLASPDFSVDSQGNIYSISRDRSYVAKYDTAGNELFTFGQSQGYSLVQVEVDSNDTIYVNRDGHILDIYSVEGNLLSHIDINLDTNSGGIQNFVVTSQGDFYISRGSELYKFNIEGENLGRIGTSGSGNGQFSRIAGLSMASNGSLFVLDGDNERISIISPSGEFIKSFSVNPQNGDGRPDISDVSSIGVSSDGSLYITSSQNLIHLDTNGDYLDTLTEKSAGMISAGAISGMAYSESFLPTTITRSSTKIDMDLDIKDQEMAFVSGGSNYGMVDISDSYSTGNISIHAQGVEALAVSGLSTYNMGGSILRSYSSGDINVQSDGMAIAGGLISYGVSAQLSNNFFSGNITTDTPMAIAGGIGAYLMEASFDREEEVMPLILENNKFDQSKAGTDVCAFAIDENSGEPIPIEADVCSAVNVDGNDPSHFLGNSTASPLDKWNFTDVWQTNANALPTLRHIAVESDNKVDDNPADGHGVDETPVVTTEPGSSNGDNISDLPPDNLAVKAKVTLKDLLPQDKNRPSATTQGTTTPNPLAKIESSKDNIIKVLGERKVTGEKPEALKVIVPKKIVQASKTPVSPMVLILSALTLLGASFVFSKKYFSRKRRKENFDDLI